MQLRMGGLLRVSSYADILQICRKLSYDDIGNDRRYAEVLIDIFNALEWEMFDDVDYAEVDWEEQEILAALSVLFPDRGVCHSNL